MLLFLLEHAPLEPWERDVLSIVREEAYYFAPQGQTKIMNEGWATYWHSKIMTQKALKAAEIIDYADHHSGTLATRPGQLNPYKLGVELCSATSRTAGTRGQFGKDYDECDDLRARRSWDKKLGLGREKIFEVRRIYNDVTFIDEFLTPEFCREQKLFTFGSSGVAAEPCSAPLRGPELRAVLATRGELERRVPAIASLAAALHKRALRRPGRCARRTGGNP